MLGNSFRVRVVQSAKIDPTCNQSKLKSWI
jgi:hypothetical protein